jgi:hypothetical protein
MSEMEFMQCLGRWKNKIHRFNINRLGDTPYQIYDDKSESWSEIKSIPQNPNYEQSLVDNTTCLNLHRRPVSDINKILIIGFPHSGTTVLRAKMGDCENSIELTNETDYVDAVLATNIPDQRIIAKTTNVPKNKAIKHAFDPHCLAPENNPLYHDYHIVSIIKNPYEIFGSLSRRFGGQYLNSFDSNDKEIKMRVNQAGFSQGHCAIHSLSTFEKFARFWLKYRNGSEPRYHCIKYEEIFDNNFSCLKNLFSKIGLNYNENTFKERQGYYSLQDISMSKAKDIQEFYKHHKAQPPDSDNSVHRSWQIHQQFKPMSNSNSYKDISQELLERINNLKIIKKLGYPSPK